MYVVCARADELPAQVLEALADYRYQVFVKRLGWAMGCEEGRELDQFDRDDTVHLLAQDDERLLTLPRQAAANGHVAKDAIVTAMQRPYGIEFAAGDKHEAFFLALADDWAAEMKTTAL